MGAGPVKMYGGSHKISETEIVSKGGLSLQAKPLHSLPIKWVLYSTSIVSQVGT